MMEEVRMKGHRLCDVALLVAPCCSPRPAAAAAAAARAARQTTPRRRRHAQRHHRYGLQPVDVQALKAVQKEMGGESAMEIKYSENMFKVPDAAAAIRDYASQGFDIVIAHGSQYGSSVQEIAKDFPKVTFAWGTDVNTFGLPNVYAYTAAAEEGGYVNGVLAAKLTKSKTIGVTGPVEVGDAKTYIDGFTQGVASVDPSIKVTKTWTGSFSDVALMTEAAKTHIAAGADVLTGSSQSVVGSIGAAKDNGNVLWFGTQADQASLAPTWWLPARSMTGPACSRKSSPSARLASWAATSYVCSSRMTA